MTEEPKTLTPKQRDNLDLLELVLQLHFRSLVYPSQEMQDAYMEARTELELRLSILTPQGGGMTKEEVLKRHVIISMKHAPIVPKHSALIAMQEFSDQQSKEFYIQYGKLSNENAALIKENAELKETIRYFNKAY